MYPDRYQLAREECYYISKGLQPNGKPWPKVESTPAISTFDKIRDNLKKTEIDSLSLILNQPAKKKDYFGNP